MELAQITAGQVVMLFLLMGTGIAAVKTGVLKPEGKQTLSNLLVYLVVPAMIVNSYRMEFNMEILHNLLAAFGMSLLALLIGTGITLALTARRKDSRTPIFRFACIFSNAAYMGFPLISALFGSEGLLYASAYVTVFNILLWTMGYGFVSGSSDPKEVLHSLLHTPVLYAMVIGLCIYLLQIPVPQLIAQPLELMANMTTPLSMVITGMLLAAGDLGCIVRSKPVWKLAAVRMLLIPAVCLAVFGLLGFRSMTNSTRPIETPDDCKGLRVRTLESSVCVDALGALGMDAVSMSFSELFTALQTGAVDGQENPLFTIYNSRFYEVQKYLSLTEHFYPVCPLMMSEITWNKLSPEQQDIVADAMKKSVDYERELAGEELDKMLEGCKEKGMEVNEVDKAPFIEAVQPVYEKYNSQFGSLIEKINAAK